MDETRIQKNIRKARDAGYSDDQIKQWLSSKGYSPSLVPPAPTTEQGILGFGVGVAKSLGDTVSSMMDVKNSPTLSLAGAVDDKIANRAQQATDFNRSQTGLTEENLAAKSDAQNAGKIAGTVAQFASPFAGAALKKAAAGVATTMAAPKAVSNTLKATGETITSLGIRPTTQEAERIIAYRANNPFLTRVSDTLTGTSKSPSTKASTATKLGIQGRQVDIGVQSKRMANQIWIKEIQPALNETKDVITKDELFALAKKKIDETLEPGKKQSLQDAFDALQDDYKSITQYSLKDAQKIKSELDDFTPTKLFKGKDVASEYAVLKHEMADAIRYKIYDSLKDQSIKQKYLDYANLSDLSSMGINALTQSKQLGGAGGFTMAMLDKALVPVSSIAGRFVYKLGNGLEIISPTKIKTLAEHLANHGVPPSEYSKFISTIIAAQQLSRLEHPDNNANDPKRKKETK